MDKIRDKIGLSTLQYIAMGLFAAMAVIRLIFVIIGGMYPVFPNLIFFAGLIAACVGLFLSNRTVFSVGVAACALRLAIMYIPPLQYVSIWNLLQLASWVMLAAAVWCKPKTNQILPLVAAALFLLSFLESLLVWTQWGEDFLRYNWDSLLSYLLCTVAFAAVGVYCSSEKAFAVVKKSVSAPAGSVAKPMQTESNIDKIMKLHELMEAGIISKEEFEEKKRQILL